MTATFDRPETSADGGRALAVLSLSEKLSAVEAGRPGSYNFAPRLGEAADPIFQSIVTKAHEIAQARDYFRREALDEEGKVVGLLVTVAASGPEVSSAD